jgi:hypothetical protein
VSQGEDVFESIARTRLAVKSRMKELEPQVGEAKCLQEMLDIIDKAIEERDLLRKQLSEARRPAATRKNVDAWAQTLELDYVVKPGDLAEHFGKSYTWGRNHLNRLVSTGALEKWGRGQYRRKPVRTGNARIHLVTRAAS